jgi:hypothetical protein
MVKPTGGSMSRIEIKSKDGELIFGQYLINEGDYLNISLARYGGDIVAFIGGVNEPYKLDKITIEANNKAKGER